MQNRKSATGRRSEGRGSVCKSAGIAPVCLFNTILFHTEAGRLLCRRLSGRRQGLCSAGRSPSLAVCPSDGPRRSHPLPAPLRCCLLGQRPAMAVLRVSNRAAWPPLPSRATVQRQRGPRPHRPPPAAMLCRRQRWGHCDHGLSSLGMASAGLNSTPSPALRVRVYLLGFYIGI